MEAIYWFFSDWMLKKVGRDGTMFLIIENFPGSVFSVLRIVSRHRRR